MLCVQTSTRSACCSVVSGGYLNTLTFVGLVLVSSCFIDPSFSVFDLFLIALNSVSVWLLSVLLLYCFPQTFTQYPTSAHRRKKDRVPSYIYINKLDARLDSLAFPVIRDETPVEISTLAIGPSALGRRIALGEGKNSLFSCELHHY